MALVNISKLRAASRMRTVAGQTLPRQGVGSGYMHKLMHRATGGRCMEDVGAVEGKAARPRLDRPGRKAGGRVGKADGGEAEDKSPANPGEVSDKESSKYLRTKASDKRWEGAKSLGQGAVNTVLGATPPKFREIGKFGKTLKAGALATGPAMLAIGAGELSAARKADKEADKFDETRKWGGRAKAKSKDRDGDDD